MLNSIFNTADYAVSSFLICLVLSMLLGVLSALVYMVSGKYTKGFVVTLSVLPLISASVIMVVNGNLGTGLAVAGAFSLVRFRSAQGSAREMLAVFLSMAVGLCLGGGYVWIGCILFAAYALMILILYKTSFGEEKTFERQLKITVPETLDYTGLFDDILAAETSAYSLEKVRTAEMGSVYELTYSIRLKSSVPSRSLLDEIRIRNGNLPVSIGRSTVGVSDL